MAANRRRSSDSLAQHDGGGDVFSQRGMRNIEFVPDSLRKNCLAATNCRKNTEGVKGTGTKENRRQ